MGNKTNASQVSFDLVTHCLWLRGEYFSLALVVTVSCLELIFCSLLQRLMIIFREASENDPLVPVFLNC